MPPVVVLGGGLGTRLGQIFGDTPKALVHLRPGLPMLRHVLSHWKTRGARRVVLCLGYRADEIERALPTWMEPGLELVVSRELSPLGTGGAVRHALRLLPDEFFVVNGDTVIDVSLDALARWHRCRAWLGSVVVHPARPDLDGDRVDVDDWSAVRAFPGRRIGVSGAWTFTGVALLQRSLFEPLPPYAFASLEANVLAPAVAGGLRLGALRTRRPFYDLGTPARLRAYADHLGDG